MHALYFPSAASGYPLSRYDACPSMGLAIHWWAATAHWCQVRLSCPCLSETNLHFYFALSWAPQKHLGRPKEILSYPVSVHNKKLTGTMQHITKGQMARNFVAGGFIVVWHQKIHASNWDGNLLWGHLHVCGKKISKKHQPVKRKNRFCLMASEVIAAWPFCCVPIATQHVRAKACRRGGLWLNGVKREGERGRSCGLNIPFQGHLNNLTFS